MSLRQAVAVTVFWGILVLWLPVLVVAYTLFVGKLILYSRRSAGTTTVLASFFARWMQHELRTRRDDPCVRLMRVLPNVSQTGLRLMAEPMLLAHRVTGYTPRLYRYPYPGVPSMPEQPTARTTFFDEALGRHLGEIEQLVILGAGLDTRSYRLPADSPVRCFEIDKPRMQAFKRAMLKKAGVDARRVTFVPADFEHQDWYEQLLAAGFEPTRPTFFLWEAVTMYLDRAAVESALERIARTAPGGAVAFDYFSTELLEDQSLYWRYNRAVLRAVGEPFATFGLDNAPPAKQHVAAFVRSCGLMLEEYRGFGQETAEKRAQAGFAVAVVPAAV